MASESRPTVLVIDDEPSLHDALRELLGAEYDVRSAPDAEQGLDRLRAERPACILLDLALPGMDGLAFLQRLRDRDARTPVIVLTATRTVPTAVRAMRLGAEDYITKPWDPDELRLAVSRAVERARLLDRVEAYAAARARPARFEDVVTRSPGLLPVIALARRMAQNDSRVLITGETGTGKELLARAMHDEGHRRAGPFIAVNCAAIPAELAESELFGHEKGAFTGALRARRGWFELAHEGTLFLDEVPCLTLDLQAKLLRVLQDGLVRRVGGETALRSDVRIVAATNRDIAGLVAAGRFREDLFYRLNVVPVHVPPLRDRRDDIPLLLDHFLAVFNPRFHKSVAGFSPEARRLLGVYDWPGNVRELEHTVERLVILEQDAAISLQHLPMNILLADRHGRHPEGLGNLVPLKDARCQFERQYILNALDRTDWNQTRAAEALGIGRSTLFQKMQQHEIAPPSGGREAGPANGPSAPPVEA